MSWTYPGNSWIGGGSREPQEFALNLPAFDRAFDEAGGETLGVRKIVEEVYKNQQTSSRGVVWNEMST